MWDLIVIGGGAAGLWAAGTAAEQGCRTLVLEKNKKPGVKILMSGGTRCNITHNCDIQGILQAFGNQARFLKPSLHGLPPQDVVAKFEELGVATKVEDTGKVFPVSDRAIDVRDALVRRLESAGAKLVSGTAVLDLKPLSISAPANRHNNAEDLIPVATNWQVTAADELGNESALESKCVLLCCGGLSYPGCGTTGDGYAWAQRLGHSVLRTMPALTPLLSPAQWVHGLKGITLSDVDVRVTTQDKAINKRLRDPRASSRGGFLWTHFGCSGPTAMNVSRFVAELENPNIAELLIDLVPSIPESQIQSSLDASTGSKTLGSVLHNYVPRSLAQHLLERAAVDAARTLAELPKKSRLQLIEDLKRLRVPLCGTRGYAKAEVTAGGVSTQEVNPKTLESRLASGLFFAGEILDVDGPIGGFNFQAAFATGHQAAMSIAAR